MKVRGSAAAAGVAIACAAAGWVSYSFLIGSTPDEEEFRYAVLSAWLRVRGLRTGEFAFWTPLLGLGIPQPFVPNFSLHPLALLLGLMSPVTWVRVLLLTHTIVGAVGMWRLGSLLSLAPLVRGVSVATFLLALPVQQYVLTDFWPSHYIVWTMAPWVLVLVWRLLDPETAARRWAGLLGLSVGLVAANANPAYFTVWAPLAAGVIAANWRRLAARATWVLAAGAISLSIAAPVVVQLMVEEGRFAAEFELSNVTDPLPPSAVWNALAAPFAATAGPRSLFFGGPFAVLAIAGAVWFARARADLVSGVVISAVLLFTTWIPLPLVSQRYQFRDVVTFCAIPLAALAANRLLQIERVRPLAVTALVLQVVLVAGSAWPLVQRTLEPEWRRASEFRGATGDAPLANTLIGHMTRPGRLLYSPAVENEVSQRALVPDGLGINALAYRGVAVVNGLFKAVSADSVWPDDRLFYGRVRTPDALMMAGPTLDVLGIRYVIALRGEPVSPALRELVSIVAARGKELVLYENRDASAGAVLLAGTAAGRDLPVFEGCDNNRILCRDMAALADYRQHGLPEVTRGVNEIRVAWSSASAPTMLVVVEMFRPGWITTSGDRLLGARPVFGGLIGVPLPIGADEVRLVYRPLAPRAAIVACCLAVIASLALIVWPSRGRALRNRNRLESAKESGRAAALD